MIAPGIAELAFAMRSPGAAGVPRGPVRVARAAGRRGDDRRATIPRRSYSIASQSDAGDVLRFIIRVIPEGKASDYLMALPLGRTRQP